MNFYKVDHEVTKKDIEKFNYDNQRIGVIVHIENDEKLILLQQRGNKSSDEQGLYEDIGGKVEKTDISYKDAIIREIKEEAGDVELSISDSIGIYHCPKKDINWIFIIYFAKYIRGKFEIKEKDKCLGYKFFSYEDSINSPLVSDSCKYLIKKIRE